MPRVAAVSILVVYPVKQHGPRIVADPLLVTPAPGAIPFRNVFCPQSSPSALNYRRALVARIRKSRHAPELQVIHPQAAGIDVGSQMHVVAVPPECDAEPVRTFRSFTGDLH